MQGVNLVIDNGDHIVVDFEGLTIVISRDKRDGAHRIDVDSAELALTDQHPRHAVPRLHLAVNDHVEQLDADGNWRPDELYLPNVLDHLAAT